MNDPKREKEEILAEIEKVKRAKSWGWKGYIRFLVKDLEGLDDPFKDCVSVGGETTGRRSLPRVIRPY